MKVHEHIFLSTTTTNKHTCTHTTLDKNPWLGLGTVLKFSDGGN